LFPISDWEDRNLRFRSVPIRRVISLTMKLNVQKGLD
jgi:hypothetical protein